PTLARWVPLRTALAALLPFVIAVPTLAQGEGACNRDDTWLADIALGNPPCNEPGVSPLTGFRLGDPEAYWRTHLDRLISESVLEADGEGGYKYDLESGGTPVPLVLRLNPGDYAHGPLRVVEAECPR